MSPSTEEAQAERPADLVSIGAAALALGVSERALRYYQQLGLINRGRTPGGMRRYSEADLARVARIRELQSLLGLDLDEIAVVLANDDRLGESVRPTTMSTPVLRNGPSWPGSAWPCWTSCGPSSGPSRPPWARSWPTWTRGRPAPGTCSNDGRRPLPAPRDDDERRGVRSSRLGYRPWCLWPGEP